MFQLPAIAICRLLPIAGLLILGTIASHSPAADSAELAQVVSDIEAQWAAIREIHARQFTREVQQILIAAYGEAYLSILAD